MKPAEAVLVSYLTAIQPRKMGFIDLRTDVPGWCVVADFDARYRLFTSECIFDDCTDEQAKLFLESFMQGLSVNWNVSIELSKLLSRRGHLVTDAMDSLLTTVDWSCFAHQQLCLSYLALRADGPLGRRACST